MIQKKNCTLNPLFPANCPYVTAIGSTMGPEGGKKEKAAYWPRSAITSGGGFSDYFPRPFYQKKAVKEYLKNNPKDMDFDDNGRGIPDLSLMGNNYEMYLNGKKTYVSGTSASAPVLASLISLANSIRKEKKSTQIRISKSLVIFKTVRG